MVGTGRSSICLASPHIFDQPAKIFESRIEQFPFGFSNLTYLLRNGEKSLCHAHPSDLVKTAHDMRRESEILTLTSVLLEVEADFVM
jgi:aminoglycoside phosphotransferase (APT) family kinase protein